MANVQTNDTFFEGEDRRIVKMCNCPRCGGEHENLLFKKLDEPIVADGKTYSHKAECPANGERILQRAICIAPVIVP